MIENDTMLCLFLGKPRDCLTMCTEKYEKYGVDPYPKAAKPSTKEFQSPKLLFYDFVLTFK